MPRYYDPVRMHMVMQHCQSPYCAILLGWLRKKIQGEIASACASTVSTCGGSCRIEASLSFSAGGLRVTRAFLNTRDYLWSSAPATRQKLCTMRQIAEFVAVLACSLFTGAAVYIRLR